MRRFPVDAPRTRVIRTLERLGFRVVRDRESYFNGTGKSRWKLNPFNLAESSSYQEFNFTSNLHPVRHFQIRFSGRLHTSVNFFRSEDHTWLIVLLIVASAPRQSM